MADSPDQRENLTAALVRDYDDEQIVLWIHTLQDREEELKAEVKRLEQLGATQDDICNHRGRVIFEQDARIEALEVEVKRLAELVDDLTIQSTYGEYDANTLDSGAISAYAEGLRDMARRGRVRITHEKYRRVIAVFTEEELERQRAVVDAARATLEVKDE